MSVLLGDMLFNVAERCIAPFRNCFSREAAFNHFSGYVLGRCVAEDEHGVTDIIRLFSGRFDYKELNRAYEKQIRFFKADSYELEDLEKCWLDTVAAYPDLYRMDGRAMVIIDGHNAIRSGRCMPAVGRIRQSSETPSKPNITSGHLWGAVSVLAGSEETKLYPIPLAAQIQSGDKLIREWEHCEEVSGSKELQIYTGRDSSGSHVERLVRMGLGTVSKLGRIYLLGDRYFLSAATIKLVDAHNEDNEVVFISKARRNCIAWKEPVNSDSPRRGRPKKKGNKVVLSSLFDDEDSFVSTQVHMYGKDVKLSYREEVLLWGTGLYRKLKFILVSYEGTRSILVSSDISQSAKAIITNYSFRWKLEQDFKVQVQSIGTFNSHFWSKYMPKLNHYRKKTDPDPIAAVEDARQRKMILRTLMAYERHAFMTLVSQGITQILALELAKQNYDSPLYLRTRHGPVCSEENIIKDVRNLFFKGIGSGVVGPYTRKNKNASPELPHFELAN